MLVLWQGPVLPALPEHIEGEVHHPQPRAHRHAGYGPNGGPYVGVVLIDNVVGKANSHGHLQHRLDDLGHGGGRHQGVALEVSPDGGGYGDEEHRGRQGHYGAVGSGLSQKVRYLPCAENHHKTAQKAYPEEQPEGHREDLVGLFSAAHGVGRAHHPGHRNGQSGCGQHEKDGENVIRAVEVGHSLGADEIRKGYGEQKPQGLYHQGGNREDRRALHKAVLIVPSHASPSFSCPYICSVPRRYHIIIPKEMGKRKGAHKTWVRPSHKKAV